MTVSIERIRSRLAPRFPNLEQIEDNVLRFERRSHDRAYAVCYVAVPATVPDTMELLNNYQERVVARRYFQGEKSLQWSNYLFFVVDDEPKPEARAIIERDRRFARKFVLTEPELETALTPPVYQVPESIIKSDILATWTKILADNNLDRAILNDESLPSRIKLIEARFGQSALPTPASTIIPTVTKQPFLRRIELKKFRPFPQTKAFDIGTVTLICGANGSGKTSLLEAIELLYCGQTKRNPKDKDAYSILATYSDGKTETASDYRQVSTFRDRNLAWYGQLDQRSSNLYQAFSRFNFLNTDAAVGLADPKSDTALEEDLSKLMIGPDASKVWKEIERTGDKLDNEIKEQQSVNNQIKLELNSLNNQIAASDNFKQESGAVLSNLDNLLSDLSWKRIEGEPSLSVKALVESLSAYGTLAAEAIKCDWVVAPVSVSTMQDFTTNGRTKVVVVEDLLEKITGVATAQREIDREVSQLDDRLGKLRELLKYLEASFPQRLAEISRIEPLINRFPQYIVALLTDVSLPILKSADQQSVEAFAISSSSNCASVKQQLSEAKKEYAEFSTLREESEELVQRLRFVASQIIQKASNPDTCPLCHTPFQKGELGTHIHRGIDQEIDERGNTLLNLIREHEENLKQAESLQAAASLAVQSCKFLGETPTITVARLVEIASARLLANTEQTNAYNSQNIELARLKVAGMTSDGFRQLLGNAFPENTVPTIEVVNSEIATLEQTKNNKLKDKDNLKNSIQEMRNSAIDALASQSNDNPSLESAISLLKERLVKTESLLSQLKPLQINLPFESDKPLSELILAIENIRRTSGDFQATLTREQSTVSVLALASKRKTEIEKQLVSRIPRTENLVAARTVLSQIQDEHSLEGAMEEALKQNRTAIEAIFSRIHSPAEFSKIGSSLTTLVRKNSGETATLQQISTGQRAAFALSLFLAQNAQLRNAPPLILIDDPIAHVDDLNCLSFLDYLREVVIAGDRQVIFATANEKLAALYERKFDFLGDQEFKRYNLSR